MYILVVAATEDEINITTNWLNEIDTDTGPNEISVLVTGVGGTATAHALTRQIMTRTPELVINAGIGGSFSENYPPGSLVFVQEEVFADLGAFNGTDFDDVFDLGLAAVNQHPFEHRLLVNGQAKRWKKFGLPMVRAATVNCITADPRELSIITRKYSPDVESMEGAAVHYTCISEDVPFIQLRAISNYVGERDKSKWKMQDAITALNETLRRILVYVNF